ncbi:hypothetical protein [Neorhizobium vignae]|jgi:hypothetical protein|uniref:hypothetical protein n=1 Tax=Neorhizobium vignae TaxID=690585 RepID=UPI001268750C|nr:hypothetical protein [Neorhizobium vignae]
MENRSDYPFHTNFLQHGFGPVANFPLGEMSDLPFFAAPEKASAWDGMTSLIDNCQLQNFKPGILGSLKASVPLQ